MGRIGTRQPTTVFGEWLLAELEHRGWERKTLAVKSGVGITTVNQLIAGLRRPSRDMTKKIVDGFLSGSSEERTSAALLNAALVAAGFAPAEDDAEPSMMQLAQRIAATAGGEGEAYDLTPDQAEALISELEDVGRVRVRHMMKQSQSQKQSQ